MAPPDTAPDPDARLAHCQAERDALARAASHDLRQPLRSVLHCLELLERRHAEELSAPARDLLARALEATHTGHAMIDAMLEYARVQTRSAPMEAIALDDLVQRLRRDLQAELTQCGGTIAGEHLPELVADRRQLLAMLRHLVQNAIQAAGDTPPRIDIAANDLGAAGWEVIVRDQGTGLPAAAGDKIFDLFRSFPPPGKPARLGMGLAICRQIAERHHGSLTAESAPEGGSILRFTFPRFEPEAAAAVRISGPSGT